MINVSAKVNADNEFGIAYMSMHRWGGQFVGNIDIKHCSNSGALNCHCFFFCMVYTKVLLMLYHDFPIFDFLTVIQT
jgi:hypothetical protein